MGGNLGRQSESSRGRSTSTSGMLPERNEGAAGFAKHPCIRDLRHSHASVLLSGGQMVLAVSRRLGHASGQVTSDRCGHLLPEVKMALVNLLGEAGL